MVEPVWNNAQRVNHQNFAKKTHPCAKKNLVPRAVLMKSGLVSINTARQNISKTAVLVNTARQGNPQMDLQDQGVIDSGCSRHMTRNMSYLTDYEEIDGGYVAFGGNPKGGKITGKGTIKTGNLDFENVYFVRELKFNLFSVSQMCDKKNNVLFNDTECIVLSPNFKLIDESQVLLRVPRKNNMYSVDLKNIVPKGGLTCLFAKATSNESKLWHRRLGKAAQSLFRFTRVFFLSTKDETSGILKSFITGIENLVDYKVKVIRCDNGIEFKNREMNQFCEMNGILRQFSVARTPQQNRVAKRRNRILIEAAKTILVDSKYPVTILNTIDHLGKFDGKTDEDFFVGYSLNSKAFRVFNSRTRIVEENLHIRFSGSTPNVVGTQSNGFAGTKASANAGQARKETEPVKDYILLPLWTADTPYSQDPKSSHDDGSKPSSDDGKKVDEDPKNDSECKDQEKEDNVNNTNNVNTAGNINIVSSTINAVGTNKVNAVGGKTSIELPFDPNMSALEDDSIFDFSRDEEDDGAVADMNNLDTTIQASPNPTIRIHKDHPLDQVIRDLQSATQTRKMSKNLEEHGKNLKRNKKDERGIMIRNKARLVAQGYTQEEAIDYDEVFAPIARIEAIRLFLAYASFKDFVVYQMDVKSDFLYGKIEEEAYICQPSGFKDPYFFDRVYKIKKALHKGDILLVQVYVDDIIFGSTKKELFIAFEKLMHAKFQMSSIGELTFFLGLQVKQKKDVIFISQDIYVATILKKFRFTEVKTASTPIETQKPLLKDEDGEEVDVHMYRSMIGSLMYLTSSRPDIMFAVCAYARYQVNPKVSHLHVVKRVFRYLKGQLKLGLWYLKDSPFDLVAYTDSDYARASLDRKSIIRGCQFLGYRLISWQCKKQTVVSNSKTEAECVAALSCCGQVLWIQNQLLDYGYNFMHTKIFIDNNSSTIPTDPHHTPTFIQPSTQPQKTQQPRKPKRKDTHVPQPSDPIEIVTDEAVYKELGDSLVMAATTASNFEAEQDNCNTLQSDKDRLQLDELMALCTTLQNRVLDLEKTKTTQHNEIASLKRRIKKLEKKDSVHDVNVSAGEEVFVAEQEVAKEVVEVINTVKLFIDVAQVSVAGDIVSTASAATTVSTATTTTSIIKIVDDITLAQALEEMKSTKLKKNGVVIQEQCESTTTISSQLSLQQSQDKAEFDKEERLAREKAEKEEEANIALIETWDDIQTKIDVDHQLAERM
ncbi:putative ribonuclease H-like domain-containing protein [Tanacetum coccineum]